MNILDIYQLITNTLSNHNLIIKFALIILASLYILFSLIFSKQIYTLNGIIDQVTFSPIFKMFSVLNVLLAFMALFLIIVVL